MKVNSNLAVSSDAIHFAWMQLCGSVTILVKNFVSTFPQNLKVMRDWQAKCDTKHDKCQKFTCHSHLASHSQLHLWACSAKILSVTFVNSVQNNQNFFLHIQGDLCMHHTTVDVSSDMFLPLNFELAVSCNSIGSGSSLAVAQCSGRLLHQDKYILVLTVIWGGGTSNSIGT